MKRLKQFANRVMDALARTGQQAPNAGGHLFAPSGQGWRVGNGAYIPWPDMPPVYGAARQHGAPDSRRLPIGH